MMSNPSQKILLIGSGAMARDIVSLFGRDSFVATFIDPGFPVTPVEGLPVITDWEEAGAAATHYAVGVLDREHRQKARELAALAGLLPCDPLVHPSAQIARDARLAQGCLIGYYCIVGPGAHLGEDSVVMQSAIVSHDSSVGENCVILPGAWVGGYVGLGVGCFVGANSCLVPKIKLGANCFVAAGASCFKDAPAESLLLGNPARISSLAKKTPR